MEKLKDALSTVIKISEKTDEALQDGKVSIAEGVAIAMASIGLISVVRNAKEIKQEYLDLTSEQQSELTLWFNAEFDFIDDSLETIVETVFAILIQLQDVFEGLANK